MNIYTEKFIKIIKINNHYNYGILKNIIEIINKIMKFKQIMIVD